MSYRGGGGGGGGNASTGKGSSNGMASIPLASRKMVQSLKEIVNCPEPEIYAMLKECNMDPNEAVNRLLSQDPFHEVKSKREKKKENKDTTESRSRVANNTSNRGGRSGADRYAGRGGAAQFSSSEYGSLHSKPAYRKENGSQSYEKFSSPPHGAIGNSTDRRPISHSDSLAMENKASTIGMGDSTQPAFQSSWLGVPGQMSMADIVKMGRPHAKVSGIPNQPQSSVSAPLSTPHETDQSLTVLDINSLPEVPSSPPMHAHEEWPSIERLPPVSVSSVLECPMDHKSNLDQAIHHPVTEDGNVETVTANRVGSSSVTNINLQEDDSGGASLFNNNNLYQNMSPFEQNEDEDGVTSVAANLQHLSLQNDDQGAPAEDDVPSVVIPDHLQVHTPECAQLSFGSFRSGIGTSLSGSFASNPSTSNLEESSTAPDAPSIGHADTRNDNYYGDEHLGTTADENLVHGGGSNVGDYDTSSASQSEVLKQGTSEPVQGNQFPFSSSATGYSFDNSQQLNTTFSQSQTSSQMQNLTPFSSVMQAYTSSLPSTLLSSTDQTAREPDLPYSPFPVTQSMPTKYGNASSSISGPTISMTEALRAGGISAQQPNPQALPGANVATGPAIPQHLAVHPYTQPTLPLGHFANMIGYPFLAQSYTYMPSAFQQAFAGNSSYHQSLAAVLPQYKNSVSVSSLPQSAAVASGYGFGNSTSIPGQNFPLNPPTAPGATSIGFDDVLSSQYKDSNHLMSLQQQNDNSAMWVPGPGSRTMSAVPANTYYGFQGQNQQPGGFRQGQQPSQQHFGSLGYPNFYHSQSGISLEHQQQNPRDGSLGGSQGQPVKQSQQLWQNSY